VNCMEKEWDSYAVSVVDDGALLKRCDYWHHYRGKVDLLSAEGNVLESWLRDCHYNEWERMMKHFWTGFNKDDYECGGWIEVHHVGINHYCVQIEKKRKVVEKAKEERACVKCKYHFKSWYHDIDMCKRMITEEDDLICGGKQIVGPALECYKERYLLEEEEKKWWRKLWKKDRDICGKDGRYWVEK
jgi:hypothetical protein